jgi:hypothetical protein
VSRKTFAKVFFFGSLLGPLFSSSTVSLLYTLSLILFLHTHTHTHTQSITYCKTLSLSLSFFFSSPLSPHTHTHTHTQTPPPFFLPPLSSGPRPFHPSTYQPTYLPTRCGAVGIFWSYTCVSFLSSAKHTRPLLLLLLVTRFFLLPGEEGAAPSSSLSDENMRARNLRDNEVVRDEGEVARGQGGVGGGMLLCDESEQSSSSSSSSSSFPLSLSSAFSASLVFFERRFLRRRERAKRLSRVGEKSGRDAG